MNGGQNGGPGFPPAGDRSPYGEPGGYGAAQPQGGVPGSYGAPGPYGGGQQGWPDGGQQGWPGGGQQGWPGGGQAPDAGFWPQGPGGEPPRKRHTGRIVGGIVAAVAVLAAIALVIGVRSGGKPAAANSPASSASPSSSPAKADVPHSIVIPKSAGDYRRLTGGVADRIAANMRKAMNSEASQYADVYAKAKIAIYVKNSDNTQQLIFLGMSGSDSPEIARELKLGPSQEVDSMFLGMGIGDAKEYPTGPLGGVLRCGTGSMGAGKAAACVWGDSSTVGALIDPTSTGVRPLARTTLNLRNAAEH